MRRVLQRLLQREGYRVALAADGKQALESMRLEKPALMLSDVEMPRMDGFELLQNVRTTDRLRDMPVVMITSRIADKHRDHAKSLGANAYLGKPYSEDELIAVLQKYASK
jgi:chemosensory pili system protein ChpA (sensor histidine kinase/response regulator)